MNICLKSTRIIRLIKKFIYFNLQQKNEHEEASTSAADEDSDDDDDEFVAEIDSDARPVNEMWVVLLHFYNIQPSLVQFCSAVSIYLSTIWLRRLGVLLSSALERLSRKKTYNMSHGTLKPSRLNSSFDSVLKHGTVFVYWQ